MTARFSSLLQALESGETLIFGHRGACEYAPMNTFAAFDLARAAGADGVELDVHLSDDDHLVVIHDDSVDATTDDSGPVREKSLAELKALDAGGWFADDFRGERIPTLDEVFAEFGADLFINVEIKATLDQAPDIVRRLADCVRRHDLRDRVIISSFDPRTVRRAKETMPLALTGFLCHPRTPAQYFQSLEGLRLEARHPWHDMVDEQFMNWAAAQRLFVNVWTVNEIERALKLRELGVNCIITDDPARLLDAFGR